MEDVFDTLTRLISATINLAACGAAVWYIATRRPGYPWRVWYWLAATLSGSFAVFFGYTTLFGVPQGAVLQALRVMSRVNATAYGLVILLAVWFRVATPKWAATNGRT